MIRILLLGLVAQITLQAAPRLNGFIYPDRSVAVILVAALFYFGFKWRSR